MHRQFQITFSAVFAAFMLAQFCGLAATRTESDERQETRSQVTSQHPKNQIFVGGFNGITEAKVVEKDFKLLAECGIDCIYMTYFHHDKSYKSDECVKWMEKYGIRCWYNDFELNELLKKGTDVETIMRMTAPYRNSPSFIGNYLVDEPSGSDFLSLKTAVDCYHKAFPDREMYVNLFPNYAPESCFVDGSFDKYVESFVDLIDVPYISQDTYPINIINGEKILDKNYYKGLYSTASAARNSNRESWIYTYMMYDSVNAIKMYLPSIVDARFEAFNALAFGSCGITYYCFDTPPSYSGSESYGLVKNHKKTKLFQTGKKLTKEIKALSDSFLEYSWRGVGAHLNNDSPSEAIKAVPELIDLKSCFQDLIASQTLLVGLFEPVSPSNHGEAFMIVNQSDLNNPEKENVRFKIENVSTCKAIIGTKTQTLKRDKDGYFSVTIKAGQGAFVTTY